MARDVVLRWRCCLSLLSFAATIYLVTCHVLLSYLSPITYHAFLNDLSTINALPGSNVTFRTRADRLAEHRAYQQSIVHYRRSIVQLSSHFKVVRAELQLIDEIEATQQVGYDRLVAEFRIHLKRSSLSSQPQQRATSSQPQQRATSSQQSPCRGPTQ